MITMVDDEPRRLFKDRELPLDGGVTVMISGDDTPESEVFIEYRSDSLVIYTGEQAREARGKGRPSAPTSLAKSGAPLMRPFRAAPAPPFDPDYVPPPIVPRPGDRRTPSKAVEELSLAAEVVDMDEGEPHVAIPPSESDPPFAAEADEAPPPRPTSRVPKAPFDRTGAQRSMLMQNIHTSMGDQTLDLRPEVRKEAR